MPTGSVANYSGELLAVIHHDGGNRVGHVLQDGQMTPATVEPEIIFHVERDDNVIRGHHYGWKLESGCQTFVYRRSRGIVFFGPVEHDLHCIPPDITRLDPAYSKATTADVDFVSIDTDPSWGVAAPAPGPHDGFSAIDWTNNFQVFFRLKHSFYMRTGLNVTIRLKLLPYPGITASDLQDVHQAIVDAMTLHWNLAPTPTGLTSPMIFRVELVEENEDHVVQLQFDPDRKKKQNDWAGWWQDISAQSAAHELGHIIGLRDEYYLYDHDDPKNKNLRSKADERDAEKAKYPGRYDKRAETGNCTLPPNLMELVRVASPVIDIHLIDSIFTASDKQVMCFRL